MVPDDLRDLTAEDLSRILDTLATGRYGHRWQTALAREFGYHVRSVHRWANQGTRPPIEMILALHFLQQPAQLTEVAQLARLTKLTAERLEAEVTRLFPPASAENEPSGGGGA
jgi:hypothetical protein